MRHMAIIMKISMILDEKENERTNEEYLSVLFMSLLSIEVE